MSREYMNVEWAEWTCPTCLVVMEDPVTIKATTCSNQHVCYLGPVNAQNMTRRAYRSLADRRKGMAEDKHVRDTVQDMLKAWSKINPERVTKT
jgi:hypothetical protein